MNLSRPFLLGMLMLGLLIGNTRAADPVPDLPKQPSPALPTAAVIAPPSATCAPATCGDCGGCAATHSGFIGGIGFYLIQPYFENNLAFGLQTTAGRPVTRVDDRVEISHHMEVAPLVWLGYLADDGLGGRARYWYFRQGTSQTETSGGSSGGSSVLAVSSAPLGLSLMSGQGMTVTSKLEVQVADLEALDDIQTGSWDFLLSAGLRLARTDQTYNAFIPQSGPNTLLSSHTFHGAGPTAALEARRALGQSGISLYSNARGSVVFGSAHQDATIVGLNEEASDHRTRGLLIGEAELGLEYGRTVGASRVFGQIALVGQDWFGAGGASRATVNVVPGGAIAGAGYVGDSDIAFLGLAFRIGVNY